MKVLLVLCNTGIEKIQLYFGEVKSSDYLKLLDIDCEKFETIYAMKDHVKNKVMWFAEEICEYRDTPSHLYYEKIKKNLGLELIGPFQTVPNIMGFNIIRFIL